MTPLLARRLAALLLAAHALLYPLLIALGSLQDLDVVHIVLAALMLAGAASLISGRRYYWLAVVAAGILLLLGLIAIIGPFDVWRTVYTASTLLPTVLLLLGRPAPKQVDNPSRTRRFFTALANVILVFADVGPDERPWRDGCLPMLIFGVSFICLMLASPVLFIEKELVWGLVLFVVGTVPPLVLFRMARVKRRAEQRRLAESLPEVERDAKPHDDTEPPHP
ncbi:hypothetical protein [Phytoactinopolyspora mesophila]|uniref:Uncharacterized protein n=1 Tax=Phytoactinopolyspora mesophila TaxID=2650750 RepID=A0A7K3M340_9ACTN|nr:hypothetical protein [Phytoactinopolyspora mesophila]NDL56868.1 hypothetical protein [Phytoactinopolyspora mesophila]